MLGERHVGIQPLRDGHKGNENRYGRRRALPAKRLRSSTKTTSRTGGVFEGSSNDGIALIVGPSEIELGLLP